jgi:hypothetical protein
VHVAALDVVCGGKALGDQPAVILGPAENLSQQR